MKQFSSSLLRIKLDIVKLLGINIPSLQRLCGQSTFSSSTVLFRRLLLLHCYLKFPESLKTPKNPRSNFYTSGYATTPPYVSPVPVVAQGEGCHCHGRGRRARPRGFCCSPAIVHGFSYPQAPRRTGRPGPARSPWTRFHLPGHAVCEGVCGEITNCTPHHRTSAIGEWYGIMLRMELEALHREPEKISRPSPTHSSPLITTY